MHSCLSRETILLGNEQVAVQSLAGPVARLNGLNVCKQTQVPKSNDMQSFLIQFSFTQHSRTKTQD